MRKATGRTILTVAVVVVGLAACGRGEDMTTRLTGDDAIRAAEVVAQTDASHQPVDAAPSPDGTVIYYVTTGDGDAAVLRVPAGGGTAATIAQGPPLGAPSGVAVATDGGRIYIADRQAGAAGAILTVATGGGPGAASPLAGTEGWSPRGLDVVGQPGGDVVYFTGTDPANQAPGLFRVPAAGGTVSIVAEGGLLTSPDSVVVNARGAAYVTDQGAGPGQGQVLRVDGGTVTSVHRDLRLGSPAGVTLAPDDSMLLVSSIDPASGADQVLFVDLATGRSTAATKVIGANRNTAGGLHRAHAAPVLAWADVQRPGRVYRVDL